MEQGKESRSTTTHDRYQVCDPICGLVATRTSLGKALEFAKAHACEGVEVFDIMARYDCAELWDKEGKIIRFKKIG